MNQIAAHTLGLVAVGLPATAGAIWAITRHLVHRHGDDDNAQTYLAWFRAQKAAEAAELARANRPRRPAPQRKELTRR